MIFLYDILVAVTQLFSSMILNVFRPPTRVGEASAVSFFSSNSVQGPRWEYDIGKGTPDISLRVTISTLLRSTYVTMHQIDVGLPS